MRVIYGDQVNTVLSDDVSADDIFATLKNSFTELSSNGTYNLTSENGERVMRVSVRAGTKA